MRLLLLVMASHADWWTGRNCWASQERLADETGLSRRTVVTCIQGLLVLGILVKEIQDRPRRVSPRQKGYAICLGNLKGGEGGASMCNGCTSGEYECAMAAPVNVKPLRTTIEDTTLREKTTKTPSAVGPYGATALARVERETAERNARNIAAWRASQERQEVVTT